MPRPPTESVLGVDVIVRTHPVVPEIPLYLAADGIALRDHVAAIQDAEHIPCWAFAWAAGALLARVILDEPERVRGQVVVDFGAGSGIVAIAAAMAGARVVYAIDRDPHARTACIANAALSDVSIVVSAEMPETFDVLCAADVLYASDNAPLLATLAQRGRARTFLLADAFREGERGLPLPHRIERALTTFPDVDAPVDRAVLTCIETEAQLISLSEYAGVNTGISP